MTQVETRQYSLAVLIILILLCWPAAILYYFTRPKTIKQVGPAAPAAPQYKRVCPQCGRMLAEETKFCPGCGKDLS